MYTKVSLDIQTNNEYDFSMLRKHYSSNYSQLFDRQTATKWVYLYLVFFALFIIIIHDVIDYLFSFIKTVHLFIR